MLASTRCLRRQLSRAGPVGVLHATNSAVFRRTRQSSPIPSCSAKASPQQGAATTTDNQQDAGEQCSVSYRGQTVTVPKGTVIRTALLQNGLTPHNGRSQVINCRGLGTCGTCAVEVRGNVTPAQRSGRENARLNFPPHSAPQSDKLRLACQVVCAGGDLEVVKYDKFWGQGHTRLGEVQPGEVMATPLLGQLEYILEDYSAGKMQSSSEQS